MKQVFVGDPKLVQQKQGLDQSRTILVNDAKMVMVFTDIWICDIVYVYCIFLPVLGKCNNLIVTFCIIYFIML
ncbi:unnamed protein product, partial [Urochloa humidicola]